MADSSRPGGEMRNRSHPQSYHSNSHAELSSPSTRASGNAVRLHSEEYTRELPMQYRFPVRTPVAGPYVPPPPWYHHYATWGWWKENVKYWATCQGCFEDRGCCAEDGCWDSCDWKCCLSCWCPWWWGGPEHRFQGWFGEGPRQNPPRQD